MSNPLNGFVLVDKPAEWTSFDVVNKLRHTIQAGGLNTSAKKRFPVGHAGTLDPLATGLLIILLGDYTKRAQEFTHLDKSYVVEATLGLTSTTGDEEGEKTQISDNKPSGEEIDKALEQFIGQQDQLPPVFSAVKIDGKRAYQLAREGKEVAMKSRRVTIHSVTNVKYDYPKLEFTVAVSSGTYIRSLVSDIGEMLGTGAYTAKLRRLTIGEYDVKQATPVDKMDSETIYSKLQVRE